MSFHHRPGRAPVHFAGGRILAAALLLLCLAVPVMGEDAAAEENAPAAENPALTDPAAAQGDASSEETAAPVYTAADMQDLDPYNPNLSISKVDFSKQPFFGSEEGMDAYFRDCINNRCRSIVFACDMGLKVQLDGSEFCNRYGVAWTVPKMQPGKVGKQYILRVTYYPGDNVSAAYGSGDKSTLTAQESELYDAAVSWLTEHITADMTDDEKLTVLHDDLAGNTSYDMAMFNALNSSFTFDPGITAYGALIGRNTICQGYADAFKMLSEMMGFRCIRVFGTGNNVLHNWNLVELDGCWYHVDCTFDSAFGGKDGFCTKAFLFAPDSRMRRTHSWIAEDYPAAEDDSLYYYTLHGLYVSDEAELTDKLGAALTAGAPADLCIRNLKKKAVTDYLNSLGADYRLKEQGSELFLTARPQAGE